MREGRPSIAVSVCESESLRCGSSLGARSFCRAVVLAAIILAVALPAAAQPVVWTWRGGPDIAAHYGTYGTMGVADPANLPGARDGAVTWRDAGGNLWLFGGIGYGTSSFGDLNDLWKWDGAAWTWMSGSEDAEAFGIYGTKGAADPANVPGAREGAVSWIDAAGNLWLFGGFGNSSIDKLYLNDLWKWDGTNWTWMSGSDVASQPGTYGTQGVADPSNVPGSRYFANAGVDSAGNFWLFGGLGFSSTTGGNLNDLWKWDGANWTWVSGSDIAEQLGTYGTRGVSDPMNVPGARYFATFWSDSAGHLWLFGGYGTIATNPVSAGYLNDLWKWDGTSWTWVSGSNTPEQDATYGTKGVASAANVPGARSGAVSFRDAQGNLWLYGGEGHSAGGQGYLNDLWRWDGALWTWMSGTSNPDQSGIYGTLGVPDAANAPGARALGATWSGGSGSSVTLFGGYGFDSAGVIDDLNDLWTFEAPSCSPPSASVTTAAAICADSSGVSASVPDAGAGATYAWTVTGGSLDSGNGTRTITFTPTAGSTSVTLSVLVTNAGGCATAEAKVVTVNPVPGTPTATSNSPVAVGATINLFASTIPGATYSWTGPNGFTSTAQNPTIANTTAARAGTYSVTATTGSCSSPAGSTLVDVLATLTVTKAGSGTGLVTSIPSGISCGASCSAPFSTTVPVDLTATADAGSHFTGWSGGGCTGTGTCSVTLAGPVTVTATFVSDAASLYYPLTPCRLVDTRLADGPLGGPVLAANETRTFDATTTPTPTCGIPATAKSISVNYTVTGTQQPGELRAFAGNGVWTGTSVISFKAGATRANNGQLMLATDGSGTFQVTNASAGTAHLVIDVSGYWQ